MPAGFFAIDNPGRGDCGFYAFALCLIPLIQEEQVATHGANTPLWDKLKKHIPADQHKTFYAKIKNFNIHQPQKTIWKNFADILRKVLVHNEVKTINDCFETGKINESLLLNDVQAVYDYYAEQCQNFLLLYKFILFLRNPAIWQEYQAYFPAHHRRGLWQAIKTFTPHSPNHDLLEKLSILIPVIRRERRVQSIVIPELISSTNSLPSCFKSPAFHYVSSCWRLHKEYLNSIILITLLKNELLQNKHNLANSLWSKFPSSVVCGRHRCSKATFRQLIYKFDYARPNQMVLAALYRNRCNLLGKYRRDIEPNLDHISFSRQFLQQYNTGISGNMFSQHGKVYKFYNNLKNNDSLNNDVVRDKVLIEKIQHIAQYHAQVNECAEYGLSREQGIKGLLAELLAVDLSAGLQGCQVKDGSPLQGFMQRHKRPGKLATEADLRNLAEYFDIGVIFSGHGTVKQNIDDDGRQYIYIHRPTKNHWVSKFPIIANQPRFYARPQFHLFKRQSAQQQVVQFPRHLQSFNRYYRTQSLSWQEVAAIFNDYTRNDMWILRLFHLDWKNYLGNARRIVSAAETGGLSLETVIDGIIQEVQEQRIQHNFWDDYYDRVNYLCYRHYGCDLNEHLKSIASKTCR